MIFENISAKQFTFIGLAIVGVSLIIAFAFIFNPASREAYLRHEKCLNDYSEILFGMDREDTINDETMNRTINLLCNRIDPDPGIENAITNRIIASTAGFLLVIGVIMSLSGTGAWLVSKFKQRRINKTTKEK